MLYAFLFTPVHDSDGFLIHYAYRRVSVTDIGRSVATVAYLSHEIARRLADYLCGKYGIDPAGVMVGTAKFYRV